MEHFQDSAWVDYARGLTAPAQRSEMAAHLAVCPRCAGQANAFMLAARVAVDESVDTPPDYVVHAARAIFALRQPEPVRFLSQLIPALSFDSFREPMIAGVRSGQPMTRQMLYEAGPYSIDLRLDHERGSRRVWLTGQIATTEPEHRVDRLSVSLSAGGQIAAEAFTNSDGEFQLEYEPDPRLQLRIDVRPDEQIQLPLDSRVSESEEPPRGKP
jgi:anti-sigma factor RsiW